MSLPINITIKIVLLMAKFESPTILKRKLQVDFDKITLNEVCIREIFERFCEIGTVEDRKCSGRPSKLTEDKVNEIHDVRENEPQSSVRAVAMTCSIP